MALVGPTLCQSKPYAATQLMNILRRSFGVSDNRRNRGVLRQDRRGTVRAPIHPVLPPDPVIALSSNVLGLRTGPHFRSSLLLPSFNHLRFPKPTSSWPVGTEAAARRPQPEPGC
jgi:hypothetical protein